MPITRPQKAPSDPVTNEQLRLLHYPLVGSPKIDGLRCLTTDSGPRTSSMKKFPNPFVNEVLSDPHYSGLDGELAVGNIQDSANFHTASGELRRTYGQPDFTFYVFDWWKMGDVAYAARWLERDWTALRQLPRVVVLEQTLLTCADDVIAYEADMLAQGYEGAMIRSLYAKYKEGRCTFNEMNIFKRKPYVECEATIIGFTEAQLNLNPQETDERGLSKRSSHKALKVPKGTLGGFLLRNDQFGEFAAGCGEGMTDVVKQQIWDTRFDLLYKGTIATVKYQKYGSWKGPRQGKVIKIREKFDLD